MTVFSRAHTTIIEELGTNGRIDKQSTYNIGTIVGGEIRNGVPAKVDVKVECRSLDHGKAEGIARLIQTAFEKAAADLGATVTAEPVLQYKAMTIPEDDGFRADVVQRMRRNGLEPDVKIVTGGTDALVLMSIGGMESVLVLGNGCKNPHSTDEEIAIADMVTVAGNIQDLVQMAAGYDMC